MLLLLAFPLLDAGFTLLECVGSQVLGVALK
jgi:hypothetical protein